MPAIFLCVLAFIATFQAARRSLGAGLLAVTITGYLYGIMRANVIYPASHFIFDASLAGLYLAFGSEFFSNVTRDRSSGIRLWTLILIGWPCLLCLLPFQPLMVTLVGLRGNIFFLPVLIIGARLRHQDLRTFTLGLALLNLLAVAIGVSEYFVGIEPFFPKSAVTSIMYASSDVGNGFYRIPSFFTSAHAYAGSMVCTIPFLFGAWTQKQEGKRRRLLLLLGMVAALAGILMASTRTFFVIALYFVTVAAFSSKMGAWNRVIWALAIVAIGSMALTNERFQRFKTLGDSDMVMDRIAGSVNRGFFEVLLEYPMGNGLGGGGSSMPYFAQDQVQRPISIESEYARILGEQGVIGLLLWMAFIVWCLARRTAFVQHPWLPTRRLIWFWAAIWFVNAAIGVGLMTAIPITFFFLLALGWSTVVLPVETPVQFPASVGAGGPERRLSPVYVR